MNKLQQLILMALIALSLSISAIDPKDFETAEQEARYQQLITELRCPKCQNQNLKDSDAPIAEDLKAVIHEQILQGKTDEEIIEYLTARYGNFINYKPPLDKATVILWIGPLVLLFIGFIMAMRFRQQQSRAKIDTLSEEQQSKLDELLEQDKS